MPEINNQERPQRLPKVVEQIRKPETRSEYSDVLSTTMQLYLKEIFDQPNQPAIVTELKQHHGLFLFEGSILRGTATEKTHDFDSFVITDEQPIEEDLANKLEFFYSWAAEYHPDKIHFADYLVQRLQFSPQLKYLYDARVSELQRRKDFIEKSYGRPQTRAKFNSREIIHADTEFENLQNIRTAIESGDDHILTERDTPSRIIVSVLTATPSLVYETTSGALLYHQQKIVESLAKLQNTDPDKFHTFYAQLEDDFSGLHRSTAWRYPDRDIRLLAEYYLKSRQFIPQNIEEKELVDKVSQRLIRNYVVYEFNYYRTNYQVYRDNPEKLLQDMIIKHSIETGFAREDLEKLAIGETLTNQEETNLSAEAVQELKKFEKRIRLLASIREKIKMPSIEEFKEAYLKQE